MSQLAAKWQRPRDYGSLKVAVPTGAGSRSSCVGSNLMKLMPKILAGVDHRTNGAAYFKGPLGPVYETIIGSVDGPRRAAGSSCSRARISG